MKATNHQICKKKKAIRYTDNTTYMVMKIDGEHFQRENHCEGETPQLRHSL